MPHKMHTTFHAFNSIETLHTGGFLTAGLANGMLGRATTKGSENKCIKAFEAKTSELSSCSANATEKTVRHVPYSACPSGCRIGQDVVAAGGGYKSYEMRFASDRIHVDCTTRYCLDFLAAAARGLFADVKPCVLAHAPRQSSTQKTLDPTPSRFPSLASGVKK
eukprot:364699-Chlamydomonas_euryale.AAC.17